MARIMSMVLSSLGSSTLLLGNGGLRLGRVQKYFLYSAQVVAAMVRNSPRARAGFNRGWRHRLGLLYRLRQ